MWWLKRLLAAAAALIAAGAVAFFLYRYWPRSSPPGQAPLLTLASLAPLRESFNVQDGRERLLVLLSPTCPKCIAGASGLGELLTKATELRVPTLVVWMPVIASDIAPPTSAKLALVPGAQVRQFWDPKHLVSQQILTLARGQPNRLSADERQLVEHADVAWDLVALFPKGSQWTEQLPWPSLWGFPVEDSLARVRAALSAGESP
jgi:hypothetical protein